MSTAQETVLVTGASSGIGLELARLFAADSSNLVLIARSKDKLEQLADELRRRYSIEVVVLARDLTDPAAPRAIFDQLAAQGVAVDVVVNNAGFGSIGAVSDLALERQLSMIQVNVAALTGLTRLFLPGMIQRRRGGVLNVGSTAGFQPGPNMAVYYATKAYVLSFTEALAEELVATGVRATCLAPGPTATAFGADSGMGESLLFRFGAMPAAAVARAGHRGFRRGQVIVIPGLGNRLLAFSGRFAPRIVVRKIVKWLQSTRTA
jgi:uncharacterized protein